jgi:hypothetical protein
MIDASLPNDVVAYVQKHFPEESLAEATAILRASHIETGEFPSPRLLRCAVYASDGQLDRLRSYVALLALDWRDVIMAGEYEMRRGTPIHARDFSKRLR